ncbi:MAG: hypothetical protein QOJ42_7336, partial [Acidobacteriaceae bacterium]|nr:hypothetical protein [Acidobacteriaceae bacterium]
MSVLTAIPVFRELRDAICPRSRHPCKSFVKLRHGCPGHAQESVQVNSPRMFHTQKYASRHRFLRSAEPDIHLLSRTLKGRHRRLSVCSLPVPKQFVESLGSLICFAQSAIGRTWQSALGSSCLLSGSLQAAAVLRSSAGISLSVPDPRQADRQPSSGLRRVSPDCHFLFAFPARRSQPAHGS